MKFSHQTIIGEQLDDTLKSTLSNQYITYLGVSLLILYIGVYHRLDPETKETIQTKLTNPVIILAIITINFVLSFYNMLVAILLLVAIMITFSPRIKQSEKEEEHIPEEDNVEGFTSKRGNLLKHFDLKLPKSITNAVEEGLIENRRIKAQTRADKISKKNIKRGDNNSKNLTIPRRKFNPTNKEDKNLLNTRKICRDVINRIDYSYEDKPYLLKYISSRLEEIVDINNLLDDDSEDED